MKSFRTSALGLLVNLAWAASQAAAQSGAYGSSAADPLPAVNTPGIVPASYNLPATGMVSSGSVFTSGQPAATPDPNTDQVIDGAEGTSQFQEAVHSEWTQCDECSSACGHWFGSLGGLVMGRSRPNVFSTTFETSPANPLLNTQDAGANWTGGWQITAGYMCCGPCGGGPGLGFTYWGLGDMPGFAQLDSATNSLNTTINVSDPSTGSGDVEIGGVAAGTFFNNSASHRISRNDRVDNFEANLYFGTWNLGRWTIAPFAGFRYFRFDERLSFGGLASGGTWGGNGGADEAYLSFQNVNNLYGGQVGTYTNFWVTDRFGLFLGPKVGLFGNQMSGRTLLYSGDGTTAYDISAHKNDFSVMGEIDTGMTFFLRPNLFTYLGYRVVGVTNVALGDNQFLPYLIDTQGFGEVKQSGSLILHGVMMGGGWMF